MKRGREGEEREGGRGEEGRVKRGREGEERGREGVRDCMSTRSKKTCLCEGAADERINLQISADISDSNAWS